MLKTNRKAAYPPGKRPHMNNPIALLSDFGTKDWFVASMKGVILSVNPRATIVDITHDIAPGDITAGAFNLFACHSWFPKGTIFVAVVDPGVGSKRAALAVKSGGFVFVGPDNGLFSLILDNYYKSDVRSIEKTRYFQKEISSTFHGRDIFAPAAAHLSLGAAFEKLGPKVKTTVCLPTMTAARASKKGVEGCVIYIERFGNAVTNISSSLASQASRIRVKRRTIPLCSSYSDVAQGKPLAVIGSCGFVEISVNRGNAAQKMGLKIGDKVIVSDQD
jgi:S-adenosyl-L-methionine hydrolase (adenosine-forming)